MLSFSVDVFSGTGAAHATVFVISLERPLAVVDSIHSLAMSLSVN